jgi:hypothetical protein
MFNGSIKPNLRVLLDIRLTVAIAGVSILAYLGNFIENDILNFILSLIGIQGLAGVRALINSSGSKTYILAATGAVVVAGFFFTEQFGFIDPEALKDVANLMLGIVFGGGALTLNHAFKKQQ